jgi:hypothetical protein
VRIISEAKTEELILMSVSEDASAEEVMESIKEKAECCVDHLCGCNCGC